MALLAASGATAAQAAPGAIPPGTPHACVGLNVYNASSATRTLCHVRTISLSAITERADGGHDYHYEVGGSPITIASPPPGFNAVTASQSEREAYGIPREPAITETEAHARWEQEIHNFHPSAPPQALYMPVRPAGATSSLALTSELTPASAPLEGGGGGSLTKTTHGGCSSCWAGYVDTGKLSGGIEAPPFQAAGIMYKEPQRLDDCEGDDASPWVGLGGAEGTEPLDQAGTELGKGFAIAEHQAWIENYEEPVEKEDEPIPMPFFATPGADFQVVVAHGLHNEYSVDFWNAATQQAYGPVTRSSRKTYDGSSAEYIMEREGETPLADFGKWEVAEAWAQQSGAGPWDFQHHAETIYAGKRRVASTSGLYSQESGREFYVNWEGYSESNTCTPEDSAPTVATEPATEVKRASAVLHGSVDPNNGETHYYFQYGTTTSYGNKIPVEPQDIGGGTTPISVENTVTSLNPDTIYHYRLVASNKGGTSYGPDQTFTTETEQWELNGSRSSIRDPDTGSEWVFSATGSGEIAEWSKTASSGWSESRLSGGAAIAQGTSPQVVRNPNNGFMAVYYVAQNGQIWNYNTNEPGGTSGWTSYELSGHRTNVAAGTSPSVVLNPSNDDTSVYYVGENKQIWVQQWSAENSWTGYELSGKRTNVAANTSPSVAYNPSNNTTSVYYVGENKQIWVQRWSAENSWTGYELSGGGAPAKAGTSPSCVYNTTTGFTAVYYVGPHGQMWNYNWTAATSWTAYALSGGGAPAAVGASPSVTYAPSNGTTNVYYVGFNAPMWDYNWTSERSWTASALDQTPKNEYEQSELTSSRSAIRERATGSEWVFSATGSGEIIEWSKTASSGWSESRLSGGAAIAQGTTPQVVRNPTNGFMALYYVAQNGQIWNYNTYEYTGTSGWTSYELSGKRTNVAAGTSPSVVYNRNNNTTSVYYVGENKQIWVQQWSAENSWTGYELSGKRTNVAAGTSPSVVYNRNNNTTSVYYVGENKQIWVQQWSAENSWIGYELSGKRTNVAAGTSPSVVYSPGNNTTSVYYVGENKQIWVQQWSAENSWTGYELSGKRTNVAAGTSPSVVYIPGNGDTSVYYVGENAQIWVQQWSAENSWTGYELSGGGAPAVAGASPSAIYEPKTGATSVYYVATTAPTWRFNWTLETSWTAKALPYSPPYPLTEAATEVTATQGKLKGKVNPDGAETKYYFEYGMTTSYGSKTAEASAGSGTSDVEESKVITGLTASTTYHFRLVATNSHGTTDGEDHTFTTPSGLSSYTQTIDSSNSLNGVSCVPSTTDCVASDSKGKAFYATNVSATSSATWTTWKGPVESASEAVDCATSSLCLLADGGNLYYATSLGGTWTEAFAPAYSVDAISCASSSFCVEGQSGAGYFRYATNPASTSWTLESQGSASMNGVSCLSSSFCAIVSNAGDVYVADTTSQIESSSWTATDVDGSSALHGVACASTTSCLAVDGAGNVLKLAISEGKATATKQDIDGTNDLTAIACSGSSTCAAVDSTGNIFIATNGGTSWTKEDNTGTDLTSVFCASTSLCAAVDTTGKVTSFKP